MKIKIKDITDPALTDSEQHHLPEKVFVVRQKDGDHTWLAVCETLEALDEEDAHEVGVYKLQTVRSLQVTRKLI